MQWLQYSMDKFQLEVGPGHQLEVVTVVYSMGVCWLEVVLNPLG